MEINNESPPDRAAIIAERTKWVERLMELRNDAIAKGMKRTHRCNFGSACQ
ncbi:hypothetical protein FACS1894200_08490 [Spirochaetia bacterium]|nr:hypothetical protein FACS1894200_08490 [Spirochaetia bacterium]